MGVALYKDGSTHIVRGVRCEMCVFPNNRMTQKLKEGWRTTPNIEEDVQWAEEKESEVLDFDNMENSEIRQLAKAARIENWDEARIATLKKALTTNGTVSEG